MPPGGLFVAESRGMTRLLRCSPVVVFCAFIVSSPGWAETGSALAQRATAALQAGVRARVRQVPLPGAVLRKVDFFDEQTPLQIDLLGSTSQQATRVIYLLPGGGSSFESSFFTPANQNLAQFFRERGYLVVGVTPREDALGRCGEGDAAVASWGLAKHKSDLRSVVARIQAALGLPYDILGHSFGAALALDYASTWSDVGRLVVLDIDSFDPVNEPEKISWALDTSNAAATLLAQGVFSDSAGAEFKQLAIASLVNPQGDSGAPRSELGLPGNFTNRALVHFATIFSAQLPGPLTELTGLPGEWSLVQSLVAGQYDFDVNPTLDRYSFRWSSLNRLQLAALRVGSGQAPLALTRDWMAAVAESPRYRIAWGSIRAKVVWVNAELGYGHQTFAAELIRRGGNSDVSVEVVPGYGHADVLWSNSAAADVWARFLR